MVDSNFVSFEENFKQWIWAGEWIFPGMALVDRNSLSQSALFFQATRFGLARAFCGVEQGGNPILNHLRRIPRFSGFVEGESASQDKMKMKYFDYALIGEEMKLFCLVSIVLLLSPATDTPKSKAEKWLNSRMKSGLVLVHKTKKGGLKGYPIIGQTAMRYEFQQDGYRISFGFSKKIDDKMSLEQLRKAFSYVALDKIPTPDLEVKDWEIKPMTPVSSFKDGVEILDFRNGQITFRIKTQFFALSGRDTSVNVPADGGVPEGAYFQIRKKFKLDATLCCPVIKK